MRKLFAAALLTALVPTTSSAFTAEDMFTALEAQDLRVVEYTTARLATIPLAFRDSMVELGATSDTPILLVLVQTPCDRFGNTNMGVVGTPLLDGPIPPQVLLSQLGEFVCEDRSVAL